MPKNSQPAKIQYPPGCKEINEDLATDDLVRRMKDVAMAFQQMSQEDENDCFIPLARYLATDYFLEHPSRDVRLLVACAIADVFRVYAPNAPYQHPALIKQIFLFFIQQLKGLQDPKDATFKRYFYLLENLAWVKSFNICIELEESQQIFCQLFSLIFKIVNDNHSEKVKNFMLDMLTPLIIESDTVSMKLIELTLWQIIEPRKTQNKQSCWLATQILKKTSKTMEPYLISYFNNALNHGIQTNAGELSDDESTSSLTNTTSTTNEGQSLTHQAKGRGSQKNAQVVNKSITQLCDLIYELNQVCPTVMMGIIPQLEVKIRSSEEKERCEFTKLLARLFSDKYSTLADQYPELWKNFLGRFRDISVIVRTRCVQYSMHFLVNHPKLREDITEQLRQRQHDPDENVRYEVVMAIISAAKKGIENINEDLLNFVRERTLDKKFKIRREALYGMAFLYKQCQFSNNGEFEPIAESTNPQVKILSWIKNKCLHNYYQAQLEDRLLVERILHMFLIPYSAPLNQRMKILYCFYATIDAHAARAFNQLLKQQLNVRKQVKDLLDVLKDEKSDERDKNLKDKIQLCAKNLPEAVKAEEYLGKLCRNLEMNPALRQHMEIIVTSSSYPQMSEDGVVLCPPFCSTIEISVKEVLKSLGFPVQTNSFYVVIKQLMERIAPVMIDFQGLIALFDYVHDSLLGGGEYDAQFGLQNSAKRGLQLILALSTVFPAIFYGKEIFSSYLLPFLWQSDSPEISEIVLQILTNIGNSMNYEGCNQEAITSIPWWATDDVIPQIINKFILKASTTKQAKHAVQCLNAIINDDAEKCRIFGQILDNLKQDGCSLDSPYFRINLVTTGMIATSGGHLFYPKVFRSIIHKRVVQDLLLKDQRLEEEIAAQEESEKQRDNSDPAVSYEFCSEEVKCKIESIKLMVRWLYALKMATLSVSHQQHQEEVAKYHRYCENTLNLLKSIIQTGGDLNEKGLAGTTLEKAHLRLSAGLAMLKIVANDATTATSLTQTPDNQTPPIATTSTSPIISPYQWHALGRLLIDEEEFVRDRFAIKLHKGLMSLSLGLEFLALLSLGGCYEPTAPFKHRLRQYLGVNFGKRRDMSKTKMVSNLKAIFPECVMPFVIHLIAHMPFYTQYDDVTQLQKVKDCLWFVLDLLVLKNDQFSFSFFKRTFENIKTCVDRVSATNVQTNGDQNGEQNFASMTNYKIYCACDLALGLMMSKTQNFLVKEYPVQPSLPGKYYMVSQSAKDNNLKSYLPPEIHFAPPKRCGLETEILGKITKNFPANGNNTTTTTSNGNGNTTTTRTRSSRTGSISSNASAAQANNPQSSPVNQYVVLTTENLVDDSVIESEPPQILTISSDQLVKVVESGSSQPTILQITSSGSSQPITETLTVVHSSDSNTGDNVTFVDSSSVDNSIHYQTITTTAASAITIENPVLNSSAAGVRSRKQMLNNEEHTKEINSKRTRLDSDSSSTGSRSTRSNINVVKNGTTSKSDNGETEEILEFIPNHQNDKLGDSDAPLPKRRGRPPKNVQLAPVAAPAAPAAVVNATESSTHDSESDSNANVRKSSRISGKRSLSPSSPEPVRTVTSRRGPGRPPIRR